MRSVRRETPLDGGLEENISRSESDRNSNSSLGRDVKVPHLGLENGEGFAAVGNHGSTPLLLLPPPPTLVPAPAPSPALRTLIPAPVPARVARFASPLPVLDGAGLKDLTTPKPAR